MKKIVVVAMSCIAMFVNGGLNPQPCVACGETEIESECSVIVFKVKGSGKAVAASDGYKSVKSLKISKGALALTGSKCAATGDCCYDAGVFYATVKVGNKSIAVAQEMNIGVWSVFGKNLDKVRTSNFKKGKSYDLDSALYIEGDGECLTDDDLIEDLSFVASAFGKFKVSISKGTKTPKSSCYAAVDDCPECTPIYTPKSYSGWFVGKYACVGEEDCFMCDCSDTDVFGGTWKATYTSKVTTLSGARTLAGLKFDIDED